MSRPFVNALGWVWDVNTLEWVYGVQGSGGGGLTNAELRATPVPVSGMVTTDGLTDAELRASAVPVSAASLPLPAGAATAARQDTGNASLASLDTKLTNPLPVSAASLPLPAGAATAANQATEIASLASIDSKLTAPLSVDVTDDATRDLGKVDVASLDQYTPISGRLPVDGSGVTQPVSAASLPLPTGASTAALQTQPGVDIGDVTVNNGTGGAAVNIQDGGNILTVDGTVTANPATAGGKTLTYIPVAQGAAGTTVLAAASPGNRHKIIGGILTMSLLGTLKFSDGSGDLTGAMDISAAGGFVAPTSLVPWQQTAVNSALNLVTTLGAARGVVIILTEP